MTGDQTPRANLRISHINVFLTSAGQHVPLKINMGFAKNWRRSFCEDACIHAKEFRTTLTYCCFRYACLIGWECVVLFESNFAELFFEA